MAKIGGRKEGPHLSYLYTMFPPPEPFQDQLGLRTEERLEGGGDAGAHVMPSMECSDCKWSSGPGLRPSQPHRLAFDCSHTTSGRPGPRLRFPLNSRF